MKRKYSYLFVLACCFIFLAASIADLNGKWTGTIRTLDDNELPVTYNFKVDGDQLTGTAESAAGQIGVDSGKVSGNTFSFIVIVDGNRYRHTGIIYPDSCGVDIDFGESILHTTLRRMVEK